MNFIADSPEDVNGWVEGMNVTTVQKKTLNLPTKKLRYSHYTRTAQLAVAKKVW